MYIPATPKFQVVYMEGQGSQKRWIVRSEDLEKMYYIFMTEMRLNFGASANQKRVIVHLDKNTRGRLRMISHRLVSETSS